MEKIYKVLSVLGISVTLSVVGIFGTTKVLAEDDFETQQKVAEQLRESQKQAAEELEDEQLREEKKQAAEESFEIQKKAAEELREAQKKAKEEQKDVNKEDDDKDDQQDDDQDDDKFDGDDHKKIIDKTVKNLLSVANNENKEVSDKIKKIANEQNDNKDDVAEKIDVIKSRSGLKTFFIGTDYKNIGQLRSDMVKTINQIEQLKTLLDKMTSTDAKSTIESEVQTLEQERQKIEDFVKANESKFSLFGWLVKFLSE